MKNSGLLFARNHPYFPRNVCSYTPGSTIHKSPWKVQLFGWYSPGKDGGFPWRFRWSWRTKPPPFATSLLKDGNQRQLCRVNSCGVFEWKTLVVEPPIWKICGRQIWIISPSRVEHKKYECLETWIDKLDLLFRCLEKNPKKSSPEWWFFHADEYHSTINKKKSPTKTHPSGWNVKWTKNQTMTFRRLVPNIPSHPLGKSRDFPGFPNEPRVVERGGDFKKYPKSMFPKMVGFPPKSSTLIGFWGFLL